MKKFTFKKQPRETGLRAVADPWPSTEIKLGGKVCGMIHPPSYRTSDANKWTINFTVKDKGSFRWVRLARKSDDEEQAREFVKAVNDKIQEKYDLYLFED